MLVTIRFSIDMFIKIVSAVILIDRNAMKCLSIIYGGMHFIVAIQTIFDEISPIMAFGMSSKFAF